MARARNIKPSIFKNEVLGQADPLLTILFESLWCLADKAGRLEDRPLRIKAETFPYRELDINGYLTQLVSLEFIWRYKIGNKAFIQVINFDKHQSPHSTEKPSEIPECPAEQQVSTPLTVSVALNNESTSETSHINVLIPDSLNTDSPIPEKPSRTSALDSEFDEFWNLYPKKVGKDKALPAWRKKKPPIQAVLQALAWQIPSEQWNKNNGQYRPNPTTYINEGRWKDEPPEEVTF